MQYALCDLNKPRFSDHPCSDGIAAGSAAAGRVSCLEWWHHHKVLKTQQVGTLPVCLAAWLPFTLHVIMQPFDWVCNTH